MSVAAGLKALPAGVSYDDFSKCHLCQQDNPNQSFALCCGTSVCDSCFLGFAMKPTNRDCPICDEKDLPLDTEPRRVYISYKHLIEKHNHRPALERMTILLPQLVASYPENAQYKRDQLKYNQLRYGNREGVNSTLKDKLGMTRDDQEDLKTELMQMIMSGMDQKEALEKMKAKILTRPGVRLKKTPPAAASSSLSGESNLATCGHCGKAGAAKVCGRCQVTCYCNRSCQKDGWKKHKKQCGKK